MSFLRWRGTLTFPVSAQASVLPVSCCSPWASRADQPPVEFHCVSASANDPDPGGSGSALDVASGTWVAGLTSEGRDREHTIERLHAGLLTRIARGEAARRAGLNEIAGPELDDLTHQAASDALMSILGQGHQAFRGDRQSSPLGRTSS